MKDTLNISIFGLNLSLINALKNSVMNILSERYHIIWTNVTDPKINLLIINEDFIDLPHIQKLLEDKIKVLRISKNSFNASKIIENTLFLPFNCEKNLSQWLQQFYKKETFSASNIEIPEINYSRISLLNVQNILEPIFNHDDSNKFILQTKDELIALIDQEQNTIYFHPDWKNINAKELEIHIADLNNRIQFKSKLRPYDLNQGLWQFLWKNLEFTSKEYDGFYKLKKWPQLQNSEDRQNIFKLSALFSQGCNVNYAHRHLKLSKKFIYQFLEVSQSAHLLDEISSDAATFKEFDHPTDQNSSSKMLSFFSKLRKKLGI